MQEIIKNILIAGCGSFIGGSARYLITVILKSVSKGTSTIIVNLIGCFIIGLLWGLSSRWQNISESWNIFLTIGICGGFTTFSTFTKDSLMMLQNGNIAGFFIYICISIVAGIALTALGYSIAH